MAISKNLKRMIDANAPLWAGEAEIIRTYWTSTVRSRETDMLWLRRQCWKEYGGIGDSQGDTKGMVGDLIPRLQDQVPRLDISYDRHDLLHHLEKVYVDRFLLHYAFSLFRLEHQMAYIILLLLLVSNFLLYHIYP